MTGTEILAELHRCALPHIDVIRELIAEDVHWPPLKRYWERAPALIPRAARVMCLGEHHFEFAAEPYGSIGALIFAVNDEARYLVDLAAWSPPRAPNLWLGRGAMLGGEQLFGPRMQDALVIHPDVLSWLKGNCRGVVVLDEAKAAPLLRRAEPLQVASVEHGRQLRKVLEVPPVRILVPSSAERLAG